MLRDKDPSPSVHANLERRYLAAPHQTKANNYIENICIDRQKSLAIDHPMIIEFWDSVEYLNAMNTNFNVDHSSDEGLIAINLPHAESSARLAGIQFPPRTELNRLLAKSRRYEFLGRRSVRSKLLGKVIKCLVFRKK